MKPIIRVENVSRVYRMGTREIHALRDVSLAVEPGSLVALRGRSGSGKTTLLNCIGGLDQPTTGEVWVNEQEVSQLSERERVQLRRHKIGFVFQAHALLPAYTAWENVEFMLRLVGIKRSQRHARTEELLTLVGLEKWMQHRTFELSGGQQQRVAIARAIVHSPAIILADEPTGELDSSTGQQILQIFRQITVREKATVLIATHDLAVDAFADRVLQLQDGKIIQ